MGEKKLKIILAIVLSMIIAIFLGSYLGSYIFYFRVNLDPNTASFFSWIKYYKAYSNDPAVSKIIKQSLLMSYGGLLGVFVVAGALIFKPSKKGLYGDAKFAPSEELKKNKLLKTEKNLKKGDFLLMGKYGDNYIGLDNNASPHMAIAAPTGSGKGVGIVIPNLLTWNDSAIVFDPKGENFEKTSGYRAKVLKNKCYIFNPTPSAAIEVVKEDGKYVEKQKLNHKGKPIYLTSRYNPIDYVRVGEDGLPNENTVGDIRMLANILIPDTGGSDGFWKESARNLFQCIVYLILETNLYSRTMESVYKIVSTEQAPIEAKDSPEDDYCYLRYLSDEANSKGQPFSLELETMVKNIADVTEVTRSGFYGNLKSAMGLWADPLTCLATSCSDINLHDIRKKKTTVYVVTTPPNIERARPLLNMFFQQLLSINTEQERDDKLNKHRVLLLIDEFTSLGKMQIFLTAIAYLRSYGIRLMLIYQDNGQLEEVYSKAAVRTFLNNLGGKVYYAPNDIEYAEYIARILGKKTVNTKSRSRGTGLFSNSNPSENISETGIELMLPAEIMAMGKENSLITVEGLRPIKSKKIFFFKDKGLKDKASLKPLPAIANIGNLLTTFKDKEKALNDELIEEEDILNNIVDDDDLNTAFAFNDDMSEDEALELFNNDVADGDVIIDLDNLEGEEEFEDEIEEEEKDDEDMFNLIL